MGELNLGAAGDDGSREFTVAIGIGEGHHTALQKTVSALAEPFEEHRERFIAQWQRVANPEWLAAKAGDGGKLMRASHNVLLAHEDKTFSGAFVASASIPWGQAKGDDDLGGYHLVWTRDMVQTATALLACGRAETALRALVYLACTQKPDGGFAQNFWVDGTPYWSGEQLDEVAFPDHSGVAAVEGGRAGRTWRFFRLSSGRRDSWCGMRRSRTRSAGRRMPAIRPRRWRR